MISLSIIIPTYKRPKLLARAIASAVEVYKGFDIEILVVPNGKDNSWKSIAEANQQTSHIRWLPLSTSNASAARNHGLENARGKYLRFLDDDDYLLPAAADQLTLVEKENIDICSAPLVSVTPAGYSVATNNVPDTNDFVSAAICCEKVSLTQGSIFRASIAKKVKWREDIVLYDDYYWILNFAVTREASWVKLTTPVCAYVQHQGSRLSRVKRTGENLRSLVSEIFHLRNHLLQNERMTKERNDALATALLTHAHSAFPASPFFLSGVIRKAIAMSPEAYPLQPIFQSYPWLTKHLLNIEWTLLPLRYLTRGYRRALWELGRIRERFSN